MFIVCTEKKEQKTSNKLGEQWNALKIEINVYYFFVVKKKVPPCLKSADPFPLITK